MHLHLVLVALQLSGAGTFVPGAGGLNGWQKNAPIISSVSQSASATSVVLQWTTNIGSDSRGHCGSEEAVDDGIQSGATSHQIIVAGLAPSTLYTCTVTSGSISSTISATTTAAVASTPITSVSFGSVTDYNTLGPPACTQKGDTLYNFVSNDGITYLTTDDTLVGWSCLAPNSAVMVAKFSSLAPLTGADVNALIGYGPCCTPEGPQGLSPKGQGLFGLSGQLYLSLANQHQSGSPYIFNQYFGSLIMSPDHGATWNNMQAPATFASTGTVMTPYSRNLWPGNSPTSFANSSFILYGADDGTVGYLVSANRFDNGDAYVYGVSNNLSGSGSVWANGDNYYMWRVPRAKLSRLNATDYQFYVSGDGTLDGAWSASQSSAAAIISNTAKLSLTSIQFIPALNRYILMTWYYPDITNNGVSQWLVYESPHPWGTWTQIGSFAHAAQGDYNPIVLQADALAAIFSGTTMRVLWTGTFGSQPVYHMFYATMTVNH